MAFAVDTLVRNVKLRVNEDANSEFTALASGVNSTDTLASDAGLIVLLNTEKNILFGPGGVINLPATFNIAAWAANVFSHPYTDFVAVSLTGSLLFWARQVSLAGNLLTFASESVLRAQYQFQSLNYQSRTGTGTHWCRHGDGIGITPVPASGTVVIACDGCATPADFTAGTNITGLTPSQVQLLECGTAIRALVKNLHDGQMASRLPAFVEEWNDLARGEWGKIPDVLKGGSDAPFHPKFSAMAVPGGKK